MRISSAIAKQGHLRNGTKEERDLYRYALRLERGLRQNRHINRNNVQQRITTT